MDLVDHRQEAYDRVREQFMVYAERLDAADIQFIPISALHGDNVVEKSSRMPWYEGSPLLYTLETVYVRNDANHIDARFPIQTVLRLPSAVRGAPPAQPSTVNPSFIGYAGQVASGLFRPGDELIHPPTGRTARISAIHGPGEAVAEAFHPMSVMLELEPPLGLARGEMLAKPNNTPAVARDFDVMLCWLAEAPFDPARRYRLRQTTQETGCEVRAVRYKLDITTLHRNHDESPLAMNDLARVTLHTTDPVCFDSYKKNRVTGGVLLVDEAANTTVATGMIL